MKREAPILSRKNWGFSNLGKCKCFWANGKILFTIGPDWPFNICIGSIILVVFIFFMVFLAPNSGTQMQLLGFCVIGSNLVSYCLTALLNPGIVLSSPVELKESGEKQAFCQNCDMFVDEDSEHCTDCELCVRELDHHCPLSGKCIAKGNLIPFYTFLGSIFCVFLYFIVWVMVNAPTLNRKMGKHSA